MTRPDLSIIVPVFNEAGNLTALHRQICEALAGEARDFELLFVDGGSRDGSFAEAASLADHEGRVRVVRL